jgi:hypothetical protein
MGSTGAIARDRVWRVNSRESEAAMPIESDRLTGETWARCRSVSGLVSARQAVMRPNRQQREHGLR